MMGRMYLTYADDSAYKEDLQILAAVIVDADKWEQMEAFAGAIIETLPDEVRDKFTEFHASDLLNGEPPFDTLPPTMAMTILELAVTNVVDILGATVVYGGVDRRELRGTLYHDVNCELMAFRLCLACAEEWLAEQPTTPGQLPKLTLLIMDDTQNQKLKSGLQGTFHRQRKRLKQEVGDRGKLAHFHDDMYFGDSKYSVGIQMADVCGLLIQRHIMGKQDTEPLYKQLLPKIAKYRMEPSITLPS
jgi:Protein of unknown function (DUF3800)